MEYKSTLNLPKTDFQMKANLPKREPEFLEFWEKNDIYQSIREKAKNAPMYILHDGPPYANGNIHIGHTLNKTLKDIIIKYKTMRGFNSPYVPGWDCHGLPVEHQLFKELKINKHQISQVDFRKKAFDYAMRFVEIQKEQFKRLGCFGDWQRPYLTLDPGYEEAIIDSFGKLVEKGYIYRGLKPVNWCFRCETALAEAEVEYAQHSSPSVFVKFKLKKDPRYPDDTSLVIWTTTPWTLIANVAVAANPGFTYAMVKTSVYGTLILAVDLLHVLSSMGIENYEVIGNFSGKEISGFVYEHPFGLREGRVVNADYVSKDDGSGLVHTAPGHGNDDYLTGIKYGLDIIMPVDAKGNFDNSAGEFSGLNVFKANDPIIDKLRATGALLLADKISHSYPHCWRCKNPVIFRATKQWFLRIDHDGLRDKLLGVIQNDIQWVPPSGRERILAMVQTRPDWCLSRQRYWGVPIPALHCSDCLEEFLDPKVIENFARHAGKEGSDCWFKRDVNDFLSPGLKCPHCKGSSFSKGADILDVWFDSGVSHQAVLKKREYLKFPCELYLEGSDQHRGWFQSSLIPAMSIDSIPPFKGVLTHGFVVDAEGRKMSKSLGNVISPFEIIKDYGADILRLWVASSDYNEDIRISGQILSRLSEAYRKIRNTARFILSNLYDFDPDTDKVPYKDLKNIDKWIMGAARLTMQKVMAAYDNFEFHKAYKEIYYFCNEELSMNYLDMVKGRLYTHGADSLERRCAQTVIFEILNVILRMIAPIFVFTAEEIWRYIPKTKKDAPVQSVHLLNWEMPDEYFKEDAEIDIAPIRGLIPVINMTLEEMRKSGKIGSSFDAKINILTKDELRYKYLACFKEDLPEVFKVSQVEIEKTESFDEELITHQEYPDIGLQITPAVGSKCQRCWNYSLSVGKNKEHDTLCERCVNIILGSK